MMVGGDQAVVERLKPIFETLAPAPNQGWGRVGSVGSGHFTKMIHNGIEYGLMQAYAEGFSILQHKREFGLDVRGTPFIRRVAIVRRTDEGPVAGKPSNRSQFGAALSAEAPARACRPPRR